MFDTLETTPSIIQPLHYDPAQGVNVSNVCGYGNHPSCDMMDFGCEDYCHEQPVEPPVEPEPPDETNVDSLEMPQTFS